jgi:single-strand DNA-binding protein
VALNYNKVIIAGNLTKDPELRYLPSGTAVANMRLATTRRYRGKSGDMVDEVCFVDVQVFGRQAETSGEYLKRGSNILVEGRLRLNEWETDQGKRSRIVVVGERIQFISPKEDAAPASDPSKESEEGLVEYKTPDVSEVKLEPEEDDFPF